MSKVNEELRKDLFDLRMQLDLLKKERIDFDPRVEETKRKIIVVKKKIAIDEVEKRKNNG